MDSKQLTNPHSWDLTPNEAIAVQKHLAGEIIPKSETDIGDVATVAGLDVYFHQIWRLRPWWSSGFPILV
jgi:hypothetical protein